LGAPLSEASRDHVTRHNNLYSYPLQRLIGESFRRTFRPKLPRAIERECRKRVDSPSELVFTMPSDFLARKCGRIARFVSVTSNTLTSNCSLIFTANGFQRRLTAAAVIQRQRNFHDVLALRARAGLSVVLQPAHQSPRIWRRNTNITSLFPSFALPSRILQLSLTHTDLTAISP
jgi:hypothetical protein